MQAFRVSANGAIVELAVLDYAATMIGRLPPDAASQRGPS